MSPNVKLLSADNSIENYRFRGEPPDISAIRSESWNREVFAAAHVVQNYEHFKKNQSADSIDWDRTLAYREYLWDLGFGVAEALDTAQRGMGVSWENSLELINRSVSLSQTKEKAPIVCGVGTDHLSDSTSYSLQEIIDAYIFQCEAVEKAGGRIVLMASRALASSANAPEDYLTVYSTVLRQVREPVILHWLGEMFDPKLQGYWGSAEYLSASATCLDLICENEDKVRGIKMSLLSAEYEIDFREKLPPSVRMFTGDDFNYPDLIAGDSKSYSHALLGIFDAIAPIAAVALTHLADGRNDSYRSVFEPTVPLSRHIFAAPTQFYKTGITFIAYLNGHQDHFSMIGGHEKSRDLQHLSELVRLADSCGALSNPDLAAKRINKILGPQLIGV